MKNKLKFERINKLEYKGRYSLYFKASVDKDGVSVAEEDVEKNMDGYYIGKEYYAKYKEIFDLHKGYIGYDIEYWTEPYGFPYSSVDIGKRQNITFKELFELIKKDYPECKSVNEIKKYRFDFKAYYKSVFDFEYPDRISSEDLIKVATRVVEEKHNFEYLIANCKNKEVSNKEFIDKLKNQYSLYRDDVVESVANKRFANPKKYVIKTNLKGSPIVWSEGHGRDFSYEATETTRDFVVYADKNTNFDDKKTYSKKEIENLLNDKNFVVFDKEHSYCSSVFDIDEHSNISKSEVYEIVRENVDENQIKNDYQDFMKYYELAKREIKYFNNLNKKKYEEKIKQIEIEKNQGDKAEEML